MSPDEQSPTENLSCYELHGAYLHRYVGHYLRDKSLTDDFVQDTFLRYQEVSRWEEIQQPKAYLTRIARNLLIDYWRRTPIRERTQRMADIGEMLAAVDPEPLRYPDVTPNLESALERLPWKQRQIVKQHYLQGQPYSQVAEDLDMNVATVKVASMRARRKLRSILESLTKKTDS